MLLAHDAVLVTKLPAPSHAVDGGGLKGARVPRDDISDVSELAPSMGLSDTDSDDFADAAGEVAEWVKKGAWVVDRSGRLGKITAVSSGGAVTLTDFSTGQQRSDLQADRLAPATPEQINANDDVLPASLWTEDMGYGPDCSLLCLTTRSDQ
eukprot:SAG11_NODE_3057_length_2722_cov_2.016012_3_plen_152_part_00